jgi:hypothetical protein
MSELEMAEREHRYIIEEEARGYIVEYAENFYWRRHFKYTRQRIEEMRNKRIITKTQADHIVVHVESTPKMKQLIGLGLVDPWRRDEVRHIVVHRKRYYRDEFVLTPIGYKTVQKAHYRKGYAYDKKVTIASEQAKAARAKARARAKAKASKSTKKR